jgi:hypothetical protein
MKNLRIAVRPVLGNLEHVAASVLILRGEEWHIVAVLQLLRPEWASLLEFCSGQGIHITYEQGPLPAEAAAQTTPVGE